MPAKSPAVGRAAARALQALGERLRSRRKQLGLSAVATSEAAGMSRVTLHRIERGEPSVAMGAYMGLIDALGLELDLRDPNEKQLEGEGPALPETIRPAEYPQLQKLAWQLHRGQALSPAEAIELYERNWRHVERAKLDARERELIQRLLKAFGRERLLV